MKKNHWTLKPRKMKEGLHLSNATIRNSAVHPSCTSKCPVFATLLNSRLSHFLGVSVAKGSAGFSIDSVHGGMVDGRLNGRFQNVEM